MSRALLIQSLYRSLYSSAIEFYSIPDTHRYQPHDNNEKKDEKVLHLYIDDRLLYTCGERAQIVLHQASILLLLEWRDALFRES